MSHFRRLSIRAPVDEAEPLRARLLELVPVGFEELDHGDAVELAAYVPAADVERLLAELPAAVVRAVPDGWEDAWRSFHHPVTAGGLWLGPPWEEPPDRARAVVIDPGRAFGTGAHPTTRLCVELLARTTGRGSVLDVGCGSGVLAIAAAKTWPARVVAADSDPVAVAVAAENARLNGVADRVRAVLSDGYGHPAIGAHGLYDLVLANILADPLRALARDLARHLAPGGVAVLSGLLDRQAAAVVSAHRPYGLRPRRTIVIGPWATLVLESGRRGRRL